MNKLSLFLLMLSSLIYSNEISFYDVKDSDDQSTEISFLLNKVSFIKSYSLIDPSRIVIDVYQSDLKKDIQKKYNYPIKQIRASSKSDLTRIVIDLYEYVNWSKPTQEKIDDGVLLKINLKKNKDIANNIRDIIVAIDPGHGGKDPGAVSSNNLLEKDITLLIAKELQRTLRDTEGYQAVLIRSDDSTVSLNDRYQNARKYGADAFISIHADGFRLASVKGASVFIWSDESSSSVARNLSDKERKRIQAQIKNIKSYDFNEDAAKELYPNTYKKKVDQSKMLGSKILDQLKRDPYTKIHKQNVEYADFRVLKSVDIPSVLVESGFITNPEDAKRLKTKAGRRMIARSIFLGIHNYFKETPVSGSILEDYSNYLNYKIQKGDVLSEIAIRFGVTVESIKNINKLGDRPIYPGQIIKINI
ncbi:MAG: LysM peptidoglycan-binding domain-containing protein [SAR86 cluster bacterium]|uniref:N-acetylmuramoyl-L-alanine amidase n=1 Tax=SAR86 cluster bacterium TaxID=2030880 RepID=A0A520N6R9_9GAMM|nr:MAG: LysM peptidoglycan-binding domain-containing protein [SAR86 cluster bacterium]